ncbi:MAG: folate-binding protein [Rhodocyclaceae bacterium]|nr:folate-binding protein [Rhodocyclaceae bacterium]
MNPDWLALLQQSGAQIDEHGADVQDFGNPLEELRAARDATVIAPLTHLGLIRIAGDDAVDYLQNLTSNDVKKLPADQAEFNSLNSAKGRMVASLLTWRDDSDLMLLLSRDLQAPVQKKLTMYILRSKVKLTDASGEQRLLGLAGSQAAALLEGAGLPVPAADMGITRMSGGSVIRLSAQRFMLVVDAASTPALWQTLSAGARPVGTAAWRWLDIQAGIPRVSLPTQEQFVPQMINFDALGGLSFTKGCYPGQEVVARTRYLGKIKRRMFLAHADICPPAGTALFAPSTLEQACGNVVDAVAAPDGGFDLLAVIQIPCVEAGAVHLGALDGPTVQIRTLPYSLPE